MNDIGRATGQGRIGSGQGVTPTSAAYVAGFSLAGLFDCKRGNHPSDAGGEFSDARI